MPQDTKRLNKRSRHLVTAFRKDLLGTQDFLPKTATRYASTIFKFGEWTQKNTTHRSLVRVIPADIVAYRTFKEPQHTGFGFSNIVKALRQFYGFLVDTGVVVRSPISPRFRLRGLKRVNTDEAPTVKQFLEMRKTLNDQVLRFPESTHPDYRCRRVIFEGLAGTGMRLGAFMTMTPSQIRWDSNSIIIDPVTMRAKQGKGYEARMSPYFAQLLREWLDAHPTADNERIFTATDRNVRLWLKKLGPSELWTLYPHRLRHFFACLMYWRNFDGGQHDLLTVRDYLGHSSQNTTDKYTKMYRRVVDPSNPEQADALWKSCVYGDNRPFDGVFTKHLYSHLPAAYGRDLRLEKPRTGQEYVEHEVVGEFLERSA